jgi:hypothetical protein
MSPRTLCPRRKAGTEYSKISFAIGAPKCFAVWCSYKARIRLASRTLENAIK